MKPDIKFLLLAVILSVTVSISIISIMQPDSTAPGTSAGPSAQQNVQINLPDRSRTNNTGVSESEVASNTSNDTRLDEIQNTISALAIRLSELENTISNMASETGESSQTENTNTGEQWFNRDAMMSTGLSEAEISLIRERYEALEMEKLYLRDRAIREDWINTERYTEELAKINTGFSAFRDEINADVYDTLLYATGKSNRVVVQDVMQNSPASLAGIRAGDYIVRYDNQPIYSAFDLRQAITEGDVGEEIGIDLNRNGNTTTVYVPRGPLGIRMESRSIAPGSGQ